MIRDPSDPTSKGLFSKCARNHASKTKSHYRPVAHQTPQTPPASLMLKKKNRGRSGFDSQVSREQRQKMYKSGYVPPVGHYNPIRKEHPKLVWDILKTCPKPKKESTSVPKTSQEQIPQKNVPKDVEKVEQQEGEVQEAQQNKVTGNTEDKNSQKKKQCMVDMSRQTGRRNHTVESSDWGSIDVMKSIGYVRGSISKNIILSTKRKEKPGKNRLFNASNYDYDYRIVKPKRNGLMDFGRLRGRVQNLKTENSYSYQHYQYDNYVWQSNSTVFPNTKANMIDFQKQTDRYHRNQANDLSCCAF